MHSFTLTDAFFLPQIHVQDVVEAINDYAFVTSSYPVILSIENHCKSPFLLQKMARIFVETFGDKLLATPMEDIPVSNQLYVHMYLCVANGVARVHAQVHPTNMPSLSCFFVFFFHNEHM